MGKNKLKRWSEINGYSHVIQPPVEDVMRADHHLKGKWNTDFFKNDNPLILELGCGRGEYTTGMARAFPSKNFIGVDIKGARLWKGAREAFTENLNNAAFIRTRIEFISSFFGTDEVDEIWITFPDPQVKTRRAKKRLTGPDFLNSYRSFLKSSGIIHLKTDSHELFNYTCELVRSNNLELIRSTDDLYASPLDDSILGIRTYYEKLFGEQGKKITYLAFRIGGAPVINPKKYPYG